MDNIVRVGLDVGSTTVKLVVMDHEQNLLYKRYSRHFSAIKDTVACMVKDAGNILKDKITHISITGSGGLSLAERYNIPFVQEVIACSNAVKKIIPFTDVAVELGGEDAKITYYGDSIEQRMNDTCAGGTGAFIDQMAALLKTDALGLNELSKKHNIIYPIAARCGVFAKTDIQPLLNEGAAKEDIAVSIFQAVVNQTISGLAHGRAIKGKVAFLGGPLYFLSELRNRFIETLNLKEDEVIFPENSQYFVAIGAAFSSKQIYDFNKLISNPKMFQTNTKQDNKLDPLFKDDEEYIEFKKRHEKNKVERIDIRTIKGNVYLGIDAGSTTTKIALIDEEGRLIYSHYTSNMGSPLSSTINVLNNLYDKLNQDIVIVNSAVTGYGEHLIKAALKVDIGEIETVAHYKAADYFVPGVDFILDIGGQDMKSLKIKNGIIDSVTLNEACSSGCGSFIETFANSLNMEIGDFAKVAIKSKAPVDLGTRCTVFMNSKVKQAQKEGVGIEDISAGIAISIIKNALFKVIRLRNKEDLGGKIVVQGGTFYNEGVLRGFEKIVGKEVVRPDIAGIMGAFGAAIIAKEEYKAGDSSTIIKQEEIKNFSTKVSMTRCNKCNNKCLITINSFSDGRKFATGNRCERGIGQEKNKNKLPNLYEYKYKRLFKYASIQKDEAIRGIIGIPRVLNMYEDYPFWFTFFTELGYRVEISRYSTKGIYELGMDTIPSESVCYPAKLAHGHIVDLVKRGIKKIFYPSLPMNSNEDKNSNNHYNCPIVTSYPETIFANIDCLREDGITFYHPFLPFDNKSKMKIRLIEELKDEKIPDKDIKNAVEKAYAELEVYKNDIRKKGEETVKYIEDNNLKGIVLVGRPYHIDPEINHGIPELINSYGFVVLSEDSIQDFGTIERPLWCVDQWVYHSRMYVAASFVAQRKDLELIQLNSFGCGLDAVTTDQVKMIMERFGKIYTVIKIDEINNLGAVRIRVRSLIKAIKERDKKCVLPKELYANTSRVIFTKDMKKKHTLLIPQLSAIHFKFIDVVFEKGGYKVEVVNEYGFNATEEGLKCVNNDACYPAIITVGSIMHALKSGKYDLDNTSVLISQTGGGCRATNYIAFLRKALKDYGMGNIPVISFNWVGMEKNPGFKISPFVGNSFLIAILFGDALMRVLYKVRPYEIEKGSTNRLYKYWVNRCREFLKGKCTIYGYKNIIKEMINDFDNLPIYEDLVKPKVGIVGEILVKFHEGANNYIVDFLESEGVEAVMPDLLDFFMYCMYNNRVKHEKLSGKYINKCIGDISISVMESYRKHMKKAFEESNRFNPPKSIYDLANGAKKHLSLANQMGEGWFLTAEMVELIESGVDNILCLQPFACLPNHITGKGMIKELRRAYPNSNIATIDYDPGSSEVNQINRIKLMLSVAFDNMKKEYNVIS